MIYITNRDKKNRSNHALVTLLTLVFLLSLGAVSSAQNDSGFYARQQAGLRLGGWLNQGTLPTEDPLIKTDVSNNSFYAEFYGAWRIFERGFLEISLGFANRGDASVVDTVTSSQFFGNLVIYPVLAQLKYYPPGFRQLSFKPYLEGGVGLYMGRHSVQFTDARYLGIQEATRTKFSYVFGGGFDWPLSQSIGLDFNTRYFPIKFGEELFTVKDFSAVTITVGIKYLFVPTKKKHAKRPRR